MLDYLHVHRPWTWKKDKVQVPQRNEMLSLYCAAFGFISKNKEHNPEWNIPNGRYLKNLILQKVIKQYNISKLNAVIIDFYFQCARMAMTYVVFILKKVVVTGLLFPEFLKIDKNIFLSFKFETVCKQLKIVINKTNKLLQNKEFEESLFLVFQFK